ncbi:UNVERIFIED_CONTAM: hypothetical protein Slati_0762600 [Sesamum latifolium]|uniref:HTH OST-type domain-containing protein n=1 Tax=Sesamum latifolium TaxID=2727402 RepID=A0AAW2XJC5_9LAMI
MSSSNTSCALALPSEYPERNTKQMEVSNTNPSRPPLHHIWSSPQGPVAILWDIENCPVPSDVRPEDVAGNIRMALRVHPVIDGAVTMFSAYGDFNAFPRRLREGCQRTGVKLIDVPNGRKDAADKAILVDMFLFALDNRPPSSIMLISGDVDFAPALHILGQRGYTVILVIPSGVGVSSALSNAGRFVWDWPSVARGEGFLSPAKPLIPSRPCPPEIAGHLMGCQINENVDGTTASCEQNELTWVQPGDVNGLKSQLVKLLELLGGSLSLIRLPAEYQKLYGRPLFVSEYGAIKLVNLLKKMGDAITLDGKGQRKFVCLLNPKFGPVGTPVILARRDKKEKASQEDNIDLMAGVGSSDEFSDDERMVIAASDDREAREKSDLEMGDRSQTIDQKLNNFKYELQDIMVSYSCRIFLGFFEAIYQQRYKRQLDYVSLGVNHLEELLEKVRDVVVLEEEPATKGKLQATKGELLVKERAGRKCIHFVELVFSCYPFVGSFGCGTKTIEPPSASAMNPLQQLHSCISTFNVGGEY